MSTVFIALNISFDESVIAFNNANWAAPQRSAALKCHPATIKIVDRVYHFMAFIFCALFFEIVIRCV